MESKLEVIKENLTNPLYEWDVHSYSRQPYYKWERWSYKKDEVHKWDAYHSISENTPTYWYDEYSLRYDDGVQLAFKTGKPTMWCYRIWTFTDIKTAYVDGILQAISWTPVVKDKRTSSIDEVLSDAVYFRNQQNLRYGIQGFGPTPDLKGGLVASDGFSVAAGWVEIYNEATHSKELWKTSWGGPLACYNNESPLEAIKSTNRFISYFDRNMSVRFNTAVKHSIYNLDTGTFQTYSHPNLGGDLTVNYFGFKVDKSFYRSSGFNTELNNLVKQLNNYFTSEGDALVGETTGIELPEHFTSLDGNVDFDWTVYNYHSENKTFYGTGIGWIRNLASHYNYACFGNLSGTMLFETDDSNPLSTNTVSIFVPMRLMGYITYERWFDANNKICYVDPNRDEAIAAGIDNFAQYEVVDDYIFTEYTDYEIEARDIDNNTFGATHIVGGRFWLLDSHEITKTFHQENQQWRLRGIIPAYTLIPCARYTEIYNIKGHNNWDASEATPPNYFYLSEDEVEVYGEGYEPLYWLYFGYPERESHLNYYLDWSKYNPTEWRLNRFGGSDDSAIYRFLWPGFYRAISAESQYAYRSNETKLSENYSTIEQAVARLQELGLDTSYEVEEHEPPGLDRYFGPYIITYDNESILDRIEILNKPSGSQMDVPKIVHDSRRDMDLFEGDFHQIYLTEYDIYNGYIISDPYKVAFIDTVSSFNSSDYPLNSHTVFDGYLYVFLGEQGISYQRSELPISTVSSTNKNEYPTNGLMNGLWYIFRGVRKDVVYTYDRTKIIGNINYTQSIGSNVAFSLGTVGGATINLEVFKPIAEVLPYIGYESKCYFRYPQNSTFTLEGFFNITDAEENGYNKTIIHAEDNVSRLDKDAKNLLDEITYPISAVQLFYYICGFCDIPYRGSVNFPNMLIELTQRPEGDNISCRDLMENIASISGGVIVADKDGYLVFKQLNEQTRSRGSNTNNSYDVSSTIIPIQKPNAIEYKDAEGKDATFTYEDEGATLFALNYKDNLFFEGKTDEERERILEVVMGAVLAMGDIYKFDVDVVSNYYGIECGDNFVVGASSSSPRRGIVSNKSIGANGVSLTSSGELVEIINKPSVSASVIAEIDKLFFEISINKIEIRDLLFDDLIQVYNTSFVFKYGQTAFDNGELHFDLANVFDIVMAGGRIDIVCNDEPCEVQVEGGTLTIWRQRFIPDRIAKRHLALYQNDIQGRVVSNITNYDLEDTTDGYIVPGSIRIADYNFPDDDVFWTFIQALDLTKEEASYYAFGYFIEKNAEFRNYNINYDVNSSLTSTITGTFGSITFEFNEPDRYIYSFYLTGDADGLVRLPNNPKDAIIDWEECPDIFNSTLGINYADLPEPVNISGVLCEGNQLAFADDNRVLSYFRPIKVNYYISYINVSGTLTISQNIDGSLCLNGVHGLVNLDSTIVWGLVSAVGNTIEVECKVLPIVQEVVFQFHNTLDNTSKTYSSLSGTLRNSTREPNWQYLPLSSATINASGEIETYIERSLSVYNASASATYFVISIEAGGVFSEPVISIIGTFPYKVNAFTNTYEWHGAHIQTLYINLQVWGER